MRWKLLILLFVLSSCNFQTETRALNIDGYDWAAHVKTNLNYRLEEISGISWDANTHTFLCVNDEFGIVYRIRIEDYKIIEKIKFGTEGDYEGIVADGPQTYVLKSSGHLFRVDMLGGETLEYKFPYKGIEFEALILDKPKHLLYLLSKNAEENKQSRSTAIYAFDTETKQFLKKPVYHIIWDDVDVHLKSLRVSAAALHPFSKDWYVVASKEKRLIVLTSDWKVKQVYKLDKHLFKQAEGITFDAAANMYITNEADGGKPNIIKIPFKQ